MQRIIGDAGITDEMTPLYQQTIEEAARAAAPVRLIRLRARFYGLNVLLLLLAAVGICSLWGVNNYRLAEYYPALPARIAAETPLYSDPLTSQDQDYAWDVQMPTAKFGYPGLFLSDGATTGVFNDFAVYSLPPPYQPLLPILSR